MFRTKSNKTVPSSASGGALGNSFGVSQCLGFMQSKFGTSILINLGLFAVHVPFLDHWRKTLSFTTWPMTLERPTIWQKVTKRYMRQQENKKTQIKNKEYCSASKECTWKSKERPFGVSDGGGTEGNSPGGCRRHETQLSSK